MDAPAEFHQSHDSPVRPVRKRKANAYAADDENISLNSQPPLKRSNRSPGRGGVEVIDLTQDSPKKKTENNGKRNDDAPVEEKRSRKFRKRAPQSYFVVKERALTQRFTVLSRERGGTDDIPRETVRLAGSTGNVYTVNVGFVPRCDCPHANKGNQCKHIIYVMLRVLKAPEHIVYQLALLSSELREIFKNAPPIPGVETDGKDGTEKEGEDPDRKPIEGECPICYDEFEDKEATVYCKSSCGNSIHKNCMSKWVAISRGNATCPYCRAEWPKETGLNDKVRSVDTTGLERNEDGYFNVAEQLGLSDERDHSTYHQYWVRRQPGFGGRRRGGYDYDYGY